MTIMLAFVLDLFLGDPPWLPHPVRIIGRFASWLETVLRPRHLEPRSELLRGAFFAASTAGLSYAGAALITSATAAVHPWLGWLASSWLIYTTIACRSLGDAAREVRASLEAGNLDLARKQTATIVGRDTAHLDEKELVRAVVETVAENLVDAVVSPLFFAALGGAPAAVTYRAINTLDSMVGYRNQLYLYFGRASARLDDAANYVPARIGGALVVLATLATGRDWRRSLRTLIRDGRNHPSPNSGFPEAAFAGALGVRLGGLNYYGGRPHLRPQIGDAGSVLEPGHIRAATTLMYAASLIGVALAAGTEVIRSGWHGLP